MFKRIPFKTLLLLTPLMSYSVIAQQSVEVKKLSDLTFSRTLQLPAKTINLQLATLASETSGRILEFSLNVGDKVTRGQTLVRFNCITAKLNQTRVQAGLKRLNAQRQLTVQQLERAKRLTSSRSISREELDQRQTQLDADDASIEEQQSLLNAAANEIDYCQLKAPFAGTIIEKIGAKGAYATPGSPMLKIVQQDAVEIEVEIPVAQSKMLTNAKEIQFLTQNNSYPVSLRSLLHWVNPATHQQPGRLKITGKSKPAGGTRGLVSFQTPKNFIPASLIQKRDRKLGVFTLQDNKAVFAILPDAQQGQSVAVNLPAETLIIISPLQLLSDQMMVNIE